MDNENNNNENNTMYFTDTNPDSYENKTEHDEIDMSENYHLMDNKNTVEYDDMDYESESLDDEEKNAERKKTLFAYIFVIVVILLIILVSILKLL